MAKTAILPRIKCNGRCNPKTAWTQPPRAWWDMAYPKILGRVKKGWKKASRTSGYRTPEEAAKVVTGHAWWHMSPEARFTALGKVNGAPRGRAHGRRRANPATSAAPRRRASKLYDDIQGTVAPTRWLTIDIGRVQKAMVKAAKRHPDGDDWQAQLLEILLIPRLHRRWSSINRGASIKRVPGKGNVWGPGYLVKTLGGGRWNSVSTTLDRGYSHGPGVAWDGVRRETIHGFADALRAMASMNQGDDDSWYRSARWHAPALEKARIRVRMNVRPFVYETTIFPLQRPGKWRKAVEKRMRAEGRNPLTTSEAREEIARARTQRKHGRTEYAAGRHSDSLEWYGRAQGTMGPVQRHGPAHLEAVSSAVRGSSMEEGRRAHHAIRRKNPTLMIVGNPPRRRNAEVNEEEWEVINGTGIYTKDSDREIAFHKHIARSFPLPEREAIAKGIVHDHNSHLPHRGGHRGNPEELGHCPACGSGTVIPMGLLGNIMHGKCRQCGMMVSVPYSTERRSSRPPRSHRPRRGPNPLTRRETGVVIRAGAHHARQAVEAGDPRSAAWHAGTASAFAHDALQYGPKKDRMRSDAWDVAGRAEWAASQAMQTHGASRLRNRPRPAPRAGRNHGRTMGARSSLAQPWITGNPRRRATSRHGQIPGTSTRSSKKQRYYVGVKVGQPYEVFRNATTPTFKSHGDRWNAVIGPFRTRQGANVMARYGEGNPHIQTVAQAEKIARMAKAGQLPGWSKADVNPPRGKDVSSWPGYDQAMRRYKKFHGNEPPRVRIVKTKGRASGKKVVVGIGKAPEIQYVTTDPKSNKDGSLWVHRFGEKGGSEPTWVLDPDTEQVTAVGGSYRVTDWFRE